MAARATAAPSPPVPPPPHDEAFEYLEFVTGGAASGDRLPLVIALHGLGDRPESFAHAFTGFPAKARFVLPHNDVRYSDGFSWFPAGDRESAEAGQRVSEMAARLVAFAASLAKTKPTAGKPIFTGFSQGGALSLAAGVLHGGDVAAAFPVGSFMAASLVPKTNGGPRIRIEAFHGLADTLVPFDTTAARYKALESAGFSVTMHSYAGVPHAISAEEREDWFSAIAAACREVSP